MKSPLSPVESIIRLTEEKPGNFFMPGHPRYQPDELKPFFGYDNWARWLIIVEWYWLVVLGQLEKLPVKAKNQLNDQTLFLLLEKINTTLQDKEERQTKHDIIALRNLMQAIMPDPLKRHLHFCLTSYDVISTAYALQTKAAFEMAFWPKLRELDELWREKIKKNAGILQAGRTHLQTALPVTVGLWLGCLHNRFISTSNGIIMTVDTLEGNCSGAVGSYASQVLLLGTDTTNKAEKMLMKLLGLQPAQMSTQISPPESMARVLFEMTLLSGALGNLGEDCRILQSSQYGEIISPSSSSSAMPHKTANPISAENMLGMHRNVLSSFSLVMSNLISDLQRDLTNSSCMRMFAEVPVCVFHQIKTSIRLLNNFKVNEDICRQNLNVALNVLPAEALHLALQQQGIEDSHEIVNKTIVPKVLKSGKTLAKETDIYCKSGDSSFSKAWENVSAEIKTVLENPEQYIGRSKELALKEAKNSL